MTSFELVNHQLKHMFGGIEAEKNSSLEYLENIQKKIAKTMEKAQANHMKIFQAVVAIKTSLTELSENYLALSKEGKHSGGLISKLTYEITDLLQDVSEESLSLSKKMESKVQTYVPNLKKIKEKYTQSAETLQHYRKKVSLLKKNVEKQSLANIKQDEHERFERNKDKLRNAEKEYDQMLIKTTKRFVQFNAEGMKDIENDLISVLTNIGGNVMQFCVNITKHLCQHFSAHEILLAKQLKLPKRGNQKIHSLEQQISTSKESLEEAKTASYQNRKVFFEHLIEERQIQNYLKKIIDKEMTRKDGETINEVFKPRKSLIVPPAQEASKSIPFSQFQNIYNNHELKHHHHHLLQKLKEEDPIEACEDLLEIQQPTEISRGFEKQEISKGDLQISNPSSPQIQKHKDNDFEDRMKKNLQKFNKICHSNHLEREKSPLPNAKHIEKAISPSIKAIQAYKIQNNNYNSHKTVLKSPEQFFNLNYLENQKKEEPLKNPQEKLINLHEHPFNFAIFEPEKRPNFTKPPHNSRLSNNASIISGNNNPVVKSNSITIGPTTKPIIQHATVSFDNFDFLMKQHRNSEFKPNSPPQPKIQTPIINFFPQKEKKQVTESNSMDLLQL